MPSMDDGLRSELALLAAAKAPLALESVRAVGRYWPGAMSRVLAKSLEEAVIAAGGRVVLHELPPEWELVLAQMECPFEELVVVARKRSHLRQCGASEEELPK